MNFATVKIPRLGELKHWVRLRQTDLYSQFPYFLGAKTKPPKTGHLFFTEQDLSLSALRSSPKLAVVAGHVPDLKKTPVSLRKILSELQSAGFATVFVNAVSSPVTLTRKPKSIDIFLQRKNQGLDFGSWADFCRLMHLSNLRFADFNEVLLMNDSVIGPLDSLQRILTRLQESSTDVVGLTNSYHRAKHLQSYFILYKNRILNRGFLDHHYASLPYYHHKPLLVLEQETFIEAVWQKQGFTSQALFPLEFLKPLGFELTLNPTLDLAEDLIDRQSFPFVKKELLLRNPTRLEAQRRLLQRPLIQELLKTEDLLSS